jgi:hypothetical protein
MIDDERRMNRVYDVLKAECPWLENAVKESHAQRKRSGFPSIGVPPVERVQPPEPVASNGVPAVESVPGTDWP